MEFLNSFKNKIFTFNIQNFEEHALALFHWQAKHNITYRQYLENLGCNSFSIRHIYEIPFLPIRFFKTRKVCSGNFIPKVVYESSGTTGTEVSRHYVEDVNYYQKISSTIFTSFFGEIKGSVVIGLLPSYLERNNSSLVAMVADFIKRSAHPASGFYLQDYEKLYDILVSLNSNTTRIYLFGVTYALLDFSRKFQLDMPHLTVLETGGMKGRGKEMIREELHATLQSAFGSATITSEYGMTELMSQAYMHRDGFFYTPPWMKVMIRDQYDPFTIMEAGRHGGINVIDLANAHSCAFIETEDLGLSNGDGFSVLGRMDNSDVRGCNLLV